MRRASVGYRLLRLFLLGALLSLVPTVVAHASSLPRPASFEPAVGFWRSVFGTYSRNQVILHDNRRLDVVYMVLDFRPEEDPGRVLNRKEKRAREKRVKLEQKRVERALERLHRFDGRPPQITPLEARVRDRWGRVSGPVHYARASGRVRAQSVHRDAWASGSTVFGARGPAAADADLTARP